MKPRRPLLRRRKRSSITGKQMTVCISALAEKSKYTISCVDTLVSTGQTSFDPLVAKITAVNGWMILSSGTLSQAEMLSRRFIDFLLAEKDNGPRTVEKCLERAILLELPRFSAARLLAPYGWDMPTFLKEGKRKLTKERFDELTRQILDYSGNYDCELIVTGWGDEAEAHTHADATIISADRDGVLVHSGDEPFYACGNGGPVAYASLAFQNYRRGLPLAEAMYYVAEAKFMSERERGVGPNTMMWIASKTGEEVNNLFLVQPDDLAKIYEEWVKSGAPQISSSSRQLLQNIVNEELKLMKIAEHKATKQSDSQTLEPE